jgi:hypothetical protein
VTILDVVKAPRLIIGGPKIGGTAVGSNLGRPSGLILLAMGAVLIWIYLQSRAMAESVSVMFL